VEKCKRKIGKSGYIAGDNENCRIKEILASCFAAMVNMLK